MKILFKKDLEGIKKRFERFKSDEIIIRANKHDKDLTINKLSDDLVYLYNKLGII